MITAFEMCVTMLAAMLPIYFILWDGARMRKKHGFDEHYWRLEVNLVWEKLFPIMLLGGLSLTDLRGVDFTGIAAAMIKPVVVVFCLLILVQSGSRLFGRNLIDNDCFTAMFQTSVRQMTYMAFAVVGQICGMKDVMAGLAVIIFIDALISIIGAEFVFAFWGKEKSWLSRIPDQFKAKLQEKWLSNTRTLFVRGLIQAIITTLYVIAQLVFGALQVLLAILVALKSRVILACFVGLGIAIVRMHYCPFDYEYRPIKVFVATVYLVITWQGSTCIYKSLLIIGAYIRITKAQFKRITHIGIWLPICAKLILLPWLSVLFSFEAGLPKTEMLKVFAYFMLAGSISGYIMSMYKERNPSQVADIISLQLICSLMTIPLNGCLITMVPYV